MRQMLLIFLALELFVPGAIRPHVHAQCVHAAGDQEGRGQLHFHFGLADRGHTHAEHARQGHDRCGHGHEHVADSSGRQRRYRFASEAEAAAQQGSQPARAEAKLRQGDYKCSHTDYVCSHDDCSHDENVIYIGRGTLWFSPQRPEAAGPSAASSVMFAPDSREETRVAVAVLRRAAGFLGGFQPPPRQRLPHLLRI